ncbi:SNF2 family N-terminal domain-containing protein [Raineyella antarctica]|uniref:SNF2 family N-terminal domain-containing protein n=1 Tax=Raineyella antarctica TaxID=1577474 RepID=A0A1G6I9G6_9ACTN|nr:SNF2-related protein [Raineyella antarctica]SDC03167.1 SNF2 family N-terminal domain-containing protein [Raineyella antarctica]
MALDRIGYYPDVEGLDSVRGTAEYHRVLLVGPRAEDIRAQTPFRFREAGPELSDFPVGIYWRIIDDRLDAMVLADEVGSEPEPSEESVLAHADPDSFGPLGMEWLDAYWEDALPIDAPRFGKGDLTVHRASGRDATVEKRTLTLTGQPRRAVWNYRVKTEGRFVTVSEDTLEPAADATDLHSLLDSEPGTARGFGATLTYSKLSLGVTDAIFSYKATKSMYLPYQFRPVLKFLNTYAQRMLIADEVGLGKTVEAGLLWTEMAARNQANRVLVICPSALVVKWQQEMRQRFGFELERLDGAGLRRLAEKVADGKPPKEYAYVASLQTLSRATDARALLTESDFTTDLCIVDEAHQLRNPRTAAHDTGEDVSLWSPALVLLTATPLNLGNHDLLSLIQLLMPGEVKDLRDLEERIEHHEPLQNIVRSVSDRTSSNADRRRWLNEIAASPLGAALRQRTAFQDLSELLSSDTLAVEEVPRLRRYCSELHGLSAVVTRTRKSEVRQDRTVRHAVPIEVDWTDAERRFYDDYKEWVRQEARNNDIPTGFALQMPLRLAGSCLRATAKTVLSRAAIEPEVADDDWVSMPSEH